MKMRNISLLAIISTLLCSMVLLAQARAAQTINHTIDATTESGSDLATDLNAAFTSLISTNRGTSRPSYATAGTIWVNPVSGTFESINVFDGNNDLAIGSYNPSTHAYTAAGSGASLTSIGTASLGGISGTPSSTTYLRGDGSWATLPSGFTTQNDVHGSRAIGTVYRNTSGKTMFVSVFLANNTTSQNFMAYTDSSTPPTTQVAGFLAAGVGTGVTETTFNFMVLNNNYYKISADNNALTLLGSWVEWN